MVVGTAGVIIWVVVMGVKKSGIGKLQAVGFQLPYSLPPLLPPSLLLLLAPPPSPSPSASSSSGLLVLTFTSDSSIQMSGFTATFTATTSRSLPLPACGPRQKLVTFTMRTLEYANEISWLLIGFRVTTDSGSSSSSDGVLRYMVAGGGQLPAGAMSAFPSTNYSDVATDLQYRDARLVVGACGWLHVVQRFPLRSYPSLDSTPGKGQRQ